MPEMRYYYYDPERCTFVPAPLSRTHPMIQAVLVLTAAFFIAGAILLGVDLAKITPQEAALRAENEVLRRSARRATAQAAICDARFGEAQRRSVAGGAMASPCPSADYQQAGIGTIGSPAASSVVRSAGSLLAESSRSLFDVEQLIYSQNDGYRTLLHLMEMRDVRAAQLPTIIPSDGPIISNYGMRRHPILGALAMHEGLDILVPSGTPVVATGDGVVTSVGFNITYGRYVEIGHPAAGYKTLYAHLSAISGEIEPGRAVARREQIGLSGATGRTTGPHLHYEVHDLEGRTVHPLSFILPHMHPGEYTRMLRVADQPVYSYD